VIEHRIAEGDQALARRRARPERRHAADESLLEGGLVLAQKSTRQARPVPEAAKQRPLADARLGRDRIHRRT